MKKRKTVPKDALPSPRPSKWPDVWPPLALAALAFLVYANALSNGFVSDDNFQLLNNPLVVDYHRIPDVFSKHIWAFAGQELTNYYRPVQIVIYMALYYAVGFDAFTFHLVMVLIHMINTVLVFGLGERLLGNRRAALFAGALFAVHPIHTEAVVWVAVLPDALLTGVVVGAIWLFAREDGHPSTGQIAVHSALYMLALLTKETGAMLLPLLVGYEILYLRRDILALWKNKFLYGSLFAVFGVYMALRYRALGGFAPAQGNYHNLQPGEYFFSIVVLVGEYIGKLFLPTGLNYYHLFEPTRGVTLGFLFALVTLIGLIAAIPVLRSKSPLISFGIFWVLVPLAPVMNLTGVGENVFTERYLYLPSVGFVWIAGLAWEYCVQRWREPAWGAGILLLGAASYMVVVRNPEWHDDIRLFTISSQQSPKSGTLIGNLGWFHYQRGEYDRAIELYKRAIGIQPNTALFYNNMGNAYGLKGQRQEALDAIRKALALKPNYPEAHMNLGLALEAVGDSQNAKTEHEKALALKPNYVDAMTALALLKMKDKDMAGAIALLQKATATRPEFTEAHINLGVAYNDTGRYAEGAEAFKKAIEVGGKYPNIYVAHYNLGVSYSNLKALEAAASEFQLAWQMRPDFAAAKEAYEKLLPMLQKQ